MKKNPKLWIRLIKSYKFNSNSQINKNSNCSNCGILSDAQLIERNITSCLSYCVKADDLKISRLQNALKTENFEVSDFETYYKMNSRISQVPDNPELRVNECLVAERTIAKRIIRLKSRNPNLTGKSEIPEEPNEVQNIDSRKSCDNIRNLVRIRKSILKNDHLRTRSFQSFVMNKESRNNLRSISSNTPMPQISNSNVCRVEINKLEKHESAHNSDECSLVKYSHSSPLNGKKRTGGSVSTTNTRSFYDFIGKTKEECVKEKAERLIEFKKRKFDIGSALVASMRQRIKSSDQKIVGTHGEKG